MGPNKTDKLFAQQRKPQKKKKKRQPMKQEKIVSNDGTDNGLIPQTYKELIQLNSKKPKIQLKNGQKT